jgi:hypothetical protein
LEPGSLHEVAVPLQEGGFDALVPSPRRPAPRTPEEVLALAEALKREKPGRTAAQVRRILQVTAGWAPSDRTLQRLFERLELGRAAPAQVNHATLGGTGLAQPADAYELIGELSLAAAGLPQLLAQVGRWLAAALAAGRLGCDDGTDPAGAVSGAWLFISDARASAAALARDLGCAQQQLADGRVSPQQRVHQARHHLPEPALPRPAQRPRPVPPR